MMCLLSFSINASASVLDELKKTPATKYDIGVMQLELAASLMTQKLKNTNVAKSKFEIEKFIVQEADNKLYFVSVLEGRAKGINEATCHRLKEHLTLLVPMKELVEKVWPHLNNAQIKQLNTELIYATELVSKENTTFRIRC